MLLGLGPVKNEESRARAVCADACGGGSPRRNPAESRCTRRGRRRDDRITAWLLSLALLMTGAWPHQAGAWRQEITGVGGAGFDLAYALAIDANGDVVACGALDNGDAGAAFTVVKFASATGAELWRREIAGTASIDEGAQEVVLDGLGDVFAAGEIDLAFTVIKLSGTTGAELWRLSLDGTNTSFRTVQLARTLALDGAGDVVAAGFLNNEATGRDFAVVKVAGDSGAELWRYDLDGGDGAPDQAIAVAVDAAGDVVAGGELEGSGVGNDFTVVKLAGTTGDEVWIERINGTENADDGAFAVAIDAGGDVIATGVIDNTATREDFAVVKFAAATGATLWRHEIDGGGVGKISFEQGRGLALDSGGDVIAIGEVENLAAAQDITVIKFASATGAELWRREINGRDTSVALDVGFAVAVDGADDVLAAGRLENGPKSAFDLAVIKLAGATGAEVWRQEIDGDSRRTSPGQEEARAVAVDAAGDVVAAGFIDNKATDEEFTVVKLDGTTGTLGPIRGARLVLKDHADNPRRRKLLVAVGDGTVLVPPPGSADDPTSVGAEILLLNPTTLESATFVLPGGAGWQTVDGATGFVGYIYHDTAASAGPCKSLQATLRGTIKVVCLSKQETLPFSLDEPSQGSLIFSVRFGSYPPQCATFGGRISRDVGTASPGPKGFFKAVAAPPALGAACP